MNLPILNTEARREKRTQMGKVSDAMGGRASLKMGIWGDLQIYDKRRGSDSRKIVQVYQFVLGRISVSPSGHGLSVLAGFTRKCFSFGSPGIRKG